MKGQSGSSLRWIVPLVMASAAGLLVVGVVALGGAARESRELARAERTRAAASTARLLQGRVRDPRLLDELPAETRFQVRGDELVIPEEVAWIDAPVPGARELDLPWSALALLREAGAAEHVDGDHTRARELHLEALGVEGVPARGRSWILLASVWTAHRAGSGELRDRLLADLEASLDDLPLPVAAGVLLLRAAAGGTLPPAAEGALCRLPEARARALLERLAESGTFPGPRREALEARLRHVRAQRETLRTAREHLALLRSTPFSLQQAVGGDLLLLYHPEDRGGALIGARDLAAVLRRVSALPQAPERLVVGSALPPDAAPVLPLLAVAPGTDAAGGGWWERWGLGILLVVLGLCFALGLLLALRALRREALAARARNEFLTNVTHELRTPLASIRLLSDLLDQGKVVEVERRQEYYRLLAAESGRLNVLVENVLDLGRLERGERAFDKRPTRAADVLGEAIEAFTPLAARDGLELRVVLGPGDATVLADRGALVQAVLNLMENARKYAASGGVLEITAARDAARLQLRFRDRGTGIPAEDREQLFARFHRGRAHRDGRIPGLGLGLHLARSILRQHGGELHFEAPADGPGACLVVTLPLADEDVAGEPTPESTP